MEDSVQVVGYSSQMKKKKNVWNVSTIFQHMRFCIFGRLYTSVWMCSLCYCGFESNIHVLWFCKGSRNILVFLVSLSVCLSVIPFTPIMHLYFVRQFRETLSCQDLRIFFLILSSIWRCLAIQ